MKTTNLRIAVLGGGAWGTALAHHAANLNHRVRQWVLETELVSLINEKHQNSIFLPGVRLHQAIYATNSLGEALDKAQVVIVVVPSQFFRSVISQAAPWLTSDTAIISCTKGVEEGSGFTMCEIIIDQLDFVPKAGCMSGPTFAREVAMGVPSALTVASDDQDLAILFQQAFSNNRMRLYTSRDVVGVELGGAVKNPLAIAAGMISGLSLGHNSLAGMITRGLAEMGRLVVAKKGKPATVYGLAGIGDLVLTCTSAQSRNYTLGYRLAKGETLEEITASTPAIAEGVVNTGTILNLAHQHGVEMPIISAVNGVVRDHYTPWQAVDMLMGRVLKPE
ncbi:MAG: NAD(P)-dependent glycerol-3-phosphate dehydrogenase [Desulfarculales bacterium]|jgi:glycerol-3-phosphate dehydrogenase (NAD(P)+)|nr:NAD(P)-dependent glycerol-3-phosphate dehydrogenase [Desulfarculales bacterium]